LATSLALVAVAAGISLGQRLGLERQILWSAARALVQLLFVGAVLALLLQPGRSLWWSWAWVVGMIVYAGDVARRRAPEVPRLAPLAIAAFAAAALITLGVVFGLRIFPLQARTLVPIAGMMIGNSMTATVLVARRLVDELRDKPLRAHRVAVGAVAADRNHQGHRARVPARRHDRTHSRRCPTGASRARSGRGHVPHPRLGRHHHSGSRPGTGAPPLHT
jgi:ABC-type iron transport system FetAB permease component